MPFDPSSQYLLVPSSSFGRFLESRKGRWLAIIAVFAAATAVTVWSEEFLVGYIRTSVCGVSPCPITTTVQAPFAQPIALVISFTSFAVAVFLSRQLDLAGDLAFDCAWVLKLCMRLNYEVSLDRVFDRINLYLLWVTNILLVLMFISLVTFIGTVFIF